MGLLRDALSLVSESSSGGSRSGYNTSSGSGLGFGRFGQPRESCSRRQQRSSQGLLGRSARLATGFGRSSTQQGSRAGEQRVNYDRSSSSRNSHDNPPEYAPYHHDDVHQQRSYIPDDPRSGWQPQQQPQSPQPQPYFADERNNNMMGGRPAFLDSPLALPQIRYGEGEPFLRAYSGFLLAHGISEEAFIQVIDEINAVRVANPEAQIFQKGARVAGMFVPGAGHLGLMAGRAAVGIATNVSSSHSLESVLSKANNELFVPNGLAMCICTTMDVSEQVGGGRFMDSGPQNTWSAEDKIAFYGQGIAPLSLVLPPSTHTGRSDPLAIAGRALGNKNTQKQTKKAEKKDLRSNGSGRSSGRGGGRRGNDTLSDQNCLWILVSPCSRG